MRAAPALRGGDRRVLRGQKLSSFEPLCSGRRSGPAAGTAGCGAAQRWSFKLPTRPADIPGEAMKIGDTSSIEPAGLTARVVAERAAARPVRPAAADGADRVEISDVARAFGRLVGRVADAVPDPARAAQVEILR